MSITVVDRAGASATGHVRQHNEDSYLIREPLFMVADGMGGARAGELASQIAADAFARLDLAGELQGEDALREVILQANLLINEHSRVDLQVAGMGTTVIAALVDDEGERIAFANVGDSRAYLLRAGALTLLSRDHSLVSELVRLGELSEQEARDHPQRTAITRAVGVERRVDVDTFSMPARTGDIVLLCTDGLNSMLDDAAIRELMGSAADATSMVDDLVEAALAAGGEDNVTAVVFYLEDRIL